MNDESKVPQPPEAAAEQPRIGGGLELLSTWLERAKEMLDRKLRELKEQESDIYPLF